MTDDNDKPEPKPYIDPGSLIDFSYFDRMSNEDFNAWYMDWLKKSGILFVHCWAEDIVVSKIIPPYTKKESDDE